MWGESLLSEDDVFDVFERFVSSLITISHSWIRLAYINLTHTHTHTHTHSLTHSHTLTHSHAHTHTHTKHTAVLDACPGFS
jgi:hypothetical protein